MACKDQGPWRDELQAAQPAPWGLPYGKRCRGGCQGCAWDLAGAAGEPALCQGTAQLSASRDEPREANLKRCLDAAAPRSANTRPKAAGVYQGWDTLSFETPPCHVVVNHTKISWVPFIRSVTWLKSACLTSWFDALQRGVSQLPPSCLAFIGFVSFAQLSKEIQRVQKTKQPLWL